jgi:hypothetical protein
MKTSTSLSLLSLSLLTLAACQKETKIAPENIPVSTVSIVAASQDTIPDKASFKIKLIKDSMNYDETAIVFDHTASGVYNSSWDAIYFTGFGNESLSSLSGDGRALAINRLPYSPGMSIYLDMHAKVDGNFFLKTSYDNNIPANIHIWLTDTFLKDSVDIGVANYNFSVSKADTNSMGGKRFKLTLKNISQQ